MEHEPGLAFVGHAVVGFKRKPVAPQADLQEKERRKFLIGPT